MLDFETIKRIPVADVATVHYHLQLVYKGDYANCPAHCRRTNRCREFEIRTLPGAVREHLRARNPMIIDCV
jgi:hypothetical protein